MIQIQWIQEGKMIYNNREVLRNFMFCRAGCSLLGAKGFSCGLDVLLEALG
jgi:hypothetical protein